MPVGERYVTESVRIDRELIGGIELYLIAFVQLRSVFTSRELNELGDSMAERGIRLREGLDEALEGWSESHAVRGSNDDESEDYGEEDIERNADELRRLKPY